MPVGDLRGGVGVVVVVRGGGLGGEEGGEALRRLVGRGFDLKWGERVSLREEVAGGGGAVGDQGEDLGYQALLHRGVLFCFGRKSLAAGGGVLFAPFLGVCWVGGQGRTSWV